MGSVLIHCCDFCSSCCYPQKSGNIKERIIRNSEAHQTPQPDDISLCCSSACMFHHRSQHLLHSIVKQFNTLSSLQPLPSVLASASTNHLIDPKWNTELINTVLMWVCCSITCHLNQALQAIRFLSYAAPLADLFCHFWRGMQLS